MIDFNLWKDSIHNKDFVAGDIVRFTHNDRTIENRIVGISFIPLGSDINDLSECFVIADQIESAIYVPTDRANHLTKIWSN